MVLLLLMTGCGPKIGLQYAQAKAEALASPPPVAADWRPDLRLQITEPPIERAVHAALDVGLSELDGKLQTEAMGGALKLQPSARVKAIDLRVEADCGGCMSARADLSGTLGWSLGPLKGELPFSAGLGGKPKFSLDQKPDGWGITMKLAAIDRVAVQVGSLRELDVGPLLSGWISKAINKAPPVHLGDVGAELLPLRAMRIDGRPGILELQALTDVPQPGAVGPGDGPPNGADWSVRIAQQTVLSLARREAFKAGPQALDLAVDPRDLRIKGGDFELDMRLWSLGGFGWWRDYTVKGEILMRGEDMVLRGTDAAEGEHSPGAGLANPLVALADGPLLKLLTRAIDETLPTANRTEAAGFVLDAGATSAWGEDKALLVNGRFDMSRASGKGR